MSDSKISVTVNAPEGLAPVSVILSARPKDRAEFDAFVAALGGPCAFTYHSHDSTHAKTSEGHTFILDAPQSEKYGYMPPMAACIRDLKGACNGD